MGLAMISYGYMHVWSFGIVDMDSLGLAHVYP